MAQISLQEVPKEIRYWFGSEDSTEFLIDLNEKLKITGESVRILPHLLYRLETKDIDPLHFIDHVAYWLQIPKEQAISIVFEIKEKLLNPIREDLNKFGMNISLIEVSHAKPLEEVLPQIHVNPRPPVRPVEKQEKKGNLEVIKDKLTLVEERLKEEPEKKGPTIKINPTLLGLQRRPDQGEGREQGAKDANTTAPPQQDAEKPFMLFGEEPKAARPASGGRKGFSMPFGFFKKDSLPADASFSGGVSRASVTNDANTIKKPSSGRVVHYGGDGAASTPFAKEEEFFRVKDPGDQREQHEHGANNTNPQNIQNPLEKMFAAQDTNGGGGVLSKPVLEAPPSEGNVSITKNPFSFPGVGEKSGDGKPRVEGNTLHL